MFWNKGNTEEKKAKKDGETAVKERPAAAKEKPADKIIAVVEQLQAGKSLAFILPEAYGGWQLVVELNPSHPKKGRQYIASREDIVEGIPSGKKFYQFGTDHPKEIAEWVLDRKATIREL